MRRLSALAVLWLLLVARPAEAEFPAALSAWVGMGPGSVHREEFREVGPFSMTGMEAAWRFAPGRALVAAYENWDGPWGLMHIPESPSVGQDVCRAVTLGPEFSVPAGSGVGLFCRLSAGVGQLTTSGYPGMDAWISGRRLERMRESGLALSGSGGVRLVFPPGPVGFVIALRAVRTTTSRSSSTALGPTLGLTVYPLSRRTSPTSSR